MISRIRLEDTLRPFFKTDQLENGVGVLIDDDIPEADYIAIDVDQYYHSLHLANTPEIADRLILTPAILRENGVGIYIVEMKNISRPSRFSKDNLYNKFATVVDDFMKVKYSDIFLDANYNVSRFRLLFVSDAYRLKEKGFTDNQIKAFLRETKIAALQSMPAFKY